MRYKDSGLMEKIKEYAEMYALENGGATPTNNEIGEALSVTRVRAYRYLKAMDELGMIRYIDGRIHTERIDKIAPITDLSPSYLDAIPAGTPDEIEAQVDEYVSIPSVFVDNQQGPFFILKVSGESMVDAGIDSGDIVIVRKGVDARPGEIVAALIHGSSSTLKRIKQDEDGDLYLWAENESWSDERRNLGRDFTVQGVAVKVVKDIPNN
jgi:repressor LexA